MMFFSHTLCQVIIFIFVACFFLSTSKKSPDFCVYELTPGQMARMIAQVKQEKDFIYCNYANILDTTKCASIPCASTATSPSCALKPTSRPTSRIPTSARPTSTPSAPDAAPNHSYALVQANLGKADNSAPDAAPNHSYALDQANLSKADNSAPDTAPDHSSANKADDRALYTNMWSSSNGRNMELYLP